MIASARFKAVAMTTGPVAMTTGPVAMTTGPGHTTPPTRSVWKERRENATSRSVTFEESKMEITTGAVTRSFPYRTTQHRKRHAMHTVKTVPWTDLERGPAPNVAKKESVRDNAEYHVAMPQHVAKNNKNNNNNANHFVKRTTREPHNIQTTDDPSRNSTFLTSRFARLTSGGKSSIVCPEFCCFVNVSCHYTYDIHLKPRCGCADSGVSANDTSTCSVPDNSDMSWMPVMKRPPWVQGTCMGSVTKRGSDNTTGIKLHCHIDQVEDFTYTVVHWNVSTPEGALPYRPCIMFVYVNNTEPPHYKKTTVDIVIQYFGFGLIFLFIGVIMSSCKNIKA
ncbi:Hypp5780 [Branchiostoma lanceolatum]|uniref:Hypp5780 protein n=1 Tax=Branchiostoma lanceolatum TaxID=7740 RepID=A0A8J9YSF6_BRALA|nr:Hypp5780 [Branchiostoma lanceolatum]